MNEEVSRTSVSPSSTSVGSMLLPVLMEFLTSRQGNQGGLAGLVQMFQNNGLGNIAASWVSKGPNLPISADQVQSGLGTDMIQQLASKLGLPPEAAKAQIAEHLPGIVDRLTPDGKIPESGLMNTAMDFLKSRFS